MNEEITVQEKAERIRDVIRYIRRFKNAVVIIHLDDTVLDSPFFMNHIKDICRLHAVGLKVLIVPGAKKRIDDILQFGQCNVHIRRHATTIKYLSTSFGMKL